jgi:DNA phosphorothioation-associated putative methyltransferase
LDETRRDIPRHRTAIKRRDLSLPIKCALRDGLVVQASSVFDYGCGHGRDIELLGATGFTASGWDPAFFSSNACREADVVNLGYVINVIEDPGERVLTLRKAWGLCRRLLVVSAQVLVDGRGQAHVEFGDGVLTVRGTFQKFFGQAELKAYIEIELQTEAIPASLGIFYVFKDEALREQFLASRYRRRSAAPRKKLSELRFEEHRELLEQFMESIAALGRLPEADEFPEAAEIGSRFGSLKRAFALVKRVTGTDEWDAITRRRTEDLLVYLALGRFQRRPPISALPIGLRRDIRAFFGSYSGACRQADDLLFRAGNAQAVDEACRQSRVGKLLPNALYVHRAALESLDSLLRVYEGCARAYLGEIESANLIKLHRQSGKVSYLAYPDFDSDPHPALRRSVKLSLRSREIDCFDYTASNNPPILHRKETFLTTDYPLYAKFARLTEQEEKHGLLDDSATIGTREGWHARLSERGFALRGNRLVRCASAKNNAPVARIPDSSD